MEAERTTEGLGGGVETVQGANQDSQSVLIT